MAVMLMTDGGARTLVPKNGENFSLEEMQVAVDGFIQVIPVGMAKMIINENQGRAGLPKNQQATSLAYPPPNDWYSVRGDVLICTTREAGYR